MGRKSRTKGASAERELSKRLGKILGLPHGSVYRSQQYCGRGGDHGDVTGVPGIHVESKRVERGTAAVYQWLEQATDDCSTTDVPVVFHRPNLLPWVCIVELDNLVQLSRAVVAIVGTEDAPKTAEK